MTEHNLKTKLYVVIKENDDNLCLNTYGIKWHNNIPILLQINLVHLRSHHITPLLVNFRGLGAGEYTEKDPIQKAWNTIVNYQRING